MKPGTGKIELKNCRDFIEGLEEENKELKKEKEKLFDAWLYYWSAAQLGCEHSIPMSDQEGGKYQLLLDKLGED